MNKRNAVESVLVILAFGCFWGCLEAITFGGLLHSDWGVLFPYHLCPCFIMAAVFGSLVMGSALAIHKKPHLLLGIGLVASAFCWLAVPFLPASVRSTHYAPIVASAAAAISGSVTLAVVASFLKRKLERSIPVRIGAGVLSALLASVLFIVVTSYAFDKAICPDLGYGSPLPDFLGIGGIAWMAAAAVFFPLGYLLGAKLQLWLASRPVLKARCQTYQFACLILFNCCGIATTAWAAGL